MANLLADDCEGLQLPYQRVSPGDVTRAIAKERGVDPGDRIQLHSISDPLVKAYGHDGYVDWLLGYMMDRGLFDPSQEGIIIWDGARHIEGIRRLKEIFRKVYVVYCTSPVGSRLHSLFRREGEARAREIIELPSEIEFDPEIDDITDYRIQYFTEIRPAANDIVLTAREMMKN